MSAMNILAVFPWRRQYLARWKKFSTWWRRFALFQPRESPPTQTTTTNQNSPSKWIKVRGQAAVFLEYEAFRKKYSDVSVLPSSAYFYGLTTGEEISFDIEEGKTLFIKLIHVSEADKEGQCTVVTELNGVPRHAHIADAHIKPTTEARAQADPANPNHVGAPMPGMVTGVATSVGKKVKAGDNLLTLEAMKMFTTITAPQDGMVEKITVAVGAQVSSKDLLVMLKP